MCEHVYLWSPLQNFCHILTVFYSDPTDTKTDTYNDFNQQANANNSQIDDEKNNQGILPAENTIMEFTC